jgi:hypothetical protein
MGYCTEANIEAVLGYAIDDTGTSRPTTTQLTQMISDADAIINAEARRTTNATDTSGRLRVISVSLVLKMIINMFALTNPDAYGFTEIELTDDQKRVIHMEHGVWDAYTWDIQTD